MRGRLNSNVAEVYAFSPMDVVGVIGGKYNSESVRVVAHCIIDWHIEDARELAFGCVFDVCCLVK